jgi:radical SAM superfamily enzyme YgiQ (UPF0313 family)
MTRPIRVLLARLPARTSTYDPEIQECLGIEMLAAVLRAEGHEVRLLDADLEQRTVGEMADAAVAAAPDVIGVSLMGAGSLDAVRTFSRSVRERCRSAMLVGGGQLFAANPGALRACGAVRVAVRFEGERRILDLLRAHAGQARIEQLPGLLMMAGGARTCETAPLADIEDLDRLPPPSRDFAGVLRSWGLPANVQASRGCARRCAFCLAPLEPATRRFGWRSRSPESVAGELEVLGSRHGFRTFNFVDDDFLGPVPGAAERAAAIAGAIADRQLDVRFGIQCRITDVPLAAFRALRRAGLRYVFAGVETADPATSRIYRKPAGGPAAVRRIRALRRMGIQVEVGFIPLNPWSSFDQVRRDYAFLAGAAALNLRSGLNRLIVFSVSPLSRLARDRAPAEDTSAPSMCEDGTVNWTFTHPEVGAFAEALDAGTVPIRPMWTLAATSQPPVALAAESNPADGAHEARLALDECRAALDGWFTGTAMTLLDAAVRRDRLDREAARLARDGGRLALRLAPALRRHPYGRMTPAMVGEAETITATILAGLTRKE